jgi:hypothetical protein
MDVYHPKKFGRDVYHPTQILEILQATNITRVARRASQRGCGAYPPVTAPAEITRMSVQVPTQNILVTRHLTFEQQGVHMQSKAAHDH